MWQTGQPPGEPGQQPWEGMISESWTEAEHVALFLHLALLFINSLSVHQAGLVVLLSRPPGQRSHTTLQHLLLKFQAQQTCRADLGLAATTAATQLFFRGFFFLRAMFLLAGHLVVVSPCVPSLVMVAVVWWCVVAPVPQLLTD